MPAFLLTLTVLAAGAAKPAPAEDDPVLRALADEVSRYGQLTAGAFERPYYVGGSIDDLDQLEIGASFGALVSDWRYGNRQAQFDLRLGTPELDNKNFSAAGPSFDLEAMVAMHGGSGLPWESDYDAVRQGLWLDLDRQYKAAVEALAHKRAYLQTNLAPDRPPDFGAAAVTELISPLVPLSVDAEKWRRIVAQASALFRSEPSVSEATATLSAQAVNQRFASTDPVRDRFGDSQLKLVMRAEAQAADGMEVSARYVAQGRVEAQMPSEAQVLRAAKELRARLLELAAAPVMTEDYSGPVLFTGQAADWFFLRGIGEPLSRPRDPLGKPHSARMIDRLGKHVAAVTLTVRDDPTQKSWRGKPLFGAYPVDDEGVVPQPITLVEKGVLQTFYMGRVPTAKLVGSNGHSRGGAGGVGNLFVESSKRQSRSALKRKLIELAKEQDEPYGILIDDFTDAAAVGRREEMMQAVAEMLHTGDDSAVGDIRLPLPSVVYRVYPDGREELVRGAVFKAVSFRSLKDIAGMGDTPAVLNATSEGQPVSVIAPAVLVSQLELKAPTQEFEKPPAIPRPVVEAEGGSGSGSGSRNNGAGRSAGEP